MEKLKLQKAGLATLLAFSLIPSASTLSGCGSNGSESTNTQAEQPKDQGTKEENPELFSPKVKNGDYEKNQTYTFEPYTHILKYDSVGYFGQLKGLDGYIMQTETYRTWGYYIYTNVETVEATATYNPNTRVVECWQPGTPIEKVNEPAEETSHQKTYTKNQ